MSIYSLVMSTLKPLAIPTFPITKRGDHETYITFFLYDDTAAFIADDEEQKTAYYVQVDVWTKDALVFTDLYEKTRQTLKEAGFMRRGVSPDLYENDTQIYHKGLRFCYVLKD
ncbi:hypothetical protein M3611_23610 [Priestia megaterium]|uniref:hypothetical protein n=1 Tax=Priestia megaterium TaxID=1404 RepID=UPI00203FACA1|nr:hypothetical protein [Priestia megaterium]MCM3155002.1 hypothetical protein [Priestia megaterium]